MFLLKHHPKALPPLYPANQTHPPTFHQKAHHPHTQVTPPSYHPPRNNSNNPTNQLTHKTKKGQALRYTNLQHLSNLHPHPSQANLPYQALHQAPNRTLVEPLRLLPRHLPPQPAPSALRLRGGSVPHPSTHPLSKNLRKSLTEVSGVGLHVGRSLGSPITCLLTAR